MDTKINDWVLYCEGRLARVQYAWGLQNQFPAPIALDPPNTPPNPSDPNALLSIYDVADGTVVLECHGGGYASGAISTDPGIIPEFLLQFTWSNGQPFTRSDS